MATYKYDGKQWIGYNEYDTALEIVQKSKNNILYLESLHDSGMVEEQLQQIRSQLNEIRTELSSLEMRTDSIEETLPLKQDELSAGLAIGIYGTTIAVKLQDIAAKLDSVPTGAAITSSSADLIRVENKLYYKTETSVGGMSTYAYEELTNSELTERIVAQIPTDFKIDDTGRLVLVHDSNVIGAGVEIGGVGVTIDAPATATQGTLTATQLGILEASETNYIMFNHEKYYLMDKQHTSGSLTYSHVGADNQINHIKTFTITLSNLTWVLIDTEVGKSEPAITIVEELPEANEENFEKGKIYTTGELLQYISKVALTEPNLQQVASLASKNYGMKSAVVGSDIYLFGSSYTTRTKIYKFSTITKTLELLSVTSNDYSSLSVAVVGSDIYIFGGTLYGKLTNVDKFNTLTYSYDSLTITLPRTSAAGSIAVVGSDIYIFGGYNEDIGYLNSIYKFSTILNQFSQAAPTLAAAVKWSNAAAVGSDIYIFGGYTSNNTAVNTIQKFNTNNLVITTLSTTLSEAVCNTGISVIGDSVYLFGGQTGRYDTNGSNKISKFSTTSETIDVLSTTLPTALSNIAAGSVDYNVYLFGGIGSSDPISSIYEAEFGYTFQYKTIATQ